MNTFGFQELLVVAVVALLVLGPERLPEFARKAGQMIARFRSEASRSVDELKRAADLHDLDRELRGLARDVRDVKGSVGRAVMEGTRPPDRPPPTDPEAT